MVKKVKTQEEKLRKKTSIGDWFLVSCIVIFGMVVFSTSPTTMW